jgi:hypothetical protein
MIYHELCYMPSGQVCYFDVENITNLYFKTRSNIIHACVALQWENERYNHSACTCMSDADHGALKGTTTFCRPTLSVTHECFQSPEA